MNSCRNYLSNLWLLIRCSVSRLSPEYIATLHHCKSAVKAAGYARICSGWAITAGLEAEKLFDSWHTQNSGYSFTINPLAMLAGTLEGRKGIADVPVRTLQAQIFGKAYAGWVEIRPLTCLPNYEAVESLSPKERVKARLLSFTMSWEPSSFLKVTIKQLFPLTQYIKGHIISKNCVDDRRAQK